MGCAGEKRLVEGGAEGGREGGREGERERGGGLIGRGGGCECESCL